MLCLGTTSAYAQPKIPALPTNVPGLPALDPQALKALAPPARPDLDKAPAAPAPAASGAPASANPPTPPTRLSARVNSKPCRVEFSPKGPELKTGPESTELRLTFRGEKGCLKAASSEQLWVEANLRSAKQEVLLQVDANESHDTRRTKVFLVAGDDQLEFTVHQAGAPRPVEAAPLPSPVDATQAVDQPLAGQGLSKELPTAQRRAEEAPVVPGPPAQQKGERAEGTDQNESAPADTKQVPGSPSTSIEPPAVEPKVPVVPAINPGPVPAEATPTAGAPSVGEDSPSTNELREVRSIDEKPSETEVLPEAMLIEKPVEKTEASPKEPDTLKGTEPVIVNNTDSLARSQSQAPLKIDDEGAPAKNDGKPVPEGYEEFDLSSED